MLYLFTDKSIGGTDNGASSSAAAVAGGSGEPTPSTSSAPAAPEVIEDEVDQFLAKQDGKVYRKRDEQL